MAIYGLKGRTTNFENEKTILLEDHFKMEPKGEKCLTD